MPISGEIQRTFGFGTELIPLLQDIEFAHDVGRNQYHSTKILDKLAEMAPAQALKVLAITEVDLFIPILTHVYGEAQIGGKACIVSTHRLKEGLSPLSAPETYRIRVVKEALHELGHTFGIVHCRDPMCVMHSYTYAEEVDFKSRELCKACFVQLRPDKA